MVNIIEEVLINRQIHIAVKFNCIILRRKILQPRAASTFRCAVSLSCAATLPYVLLLLLCAMSRCRYVVFRCVCVNCCIKNNETLDGNTFGSRCVVLMCVNLLLTAKS